MTLAYPNHLKFLMLSFMSMAVFFSCFFASVLQARAEGLTEAQIEAVLNLLIAFEVDKDTVDEVERIMRYPSEFGPGEVQGASTVSEVSVKPKAPAPSCVLIASDYRVSPRQSVVLTWESERATYASMPGGGKGPAKGSIEVIPIETTIYKKTVYGPGGESVCTVEVRVKDEGGDGGVLPTEVVVRPPDDRLLNVASALVGAAYIPFWIATDALADVFLALGIR